MASHPLKFTRREYEQLPEGFPAELIGGNLVMVPAPDPSHESLVGYLVYLLYCHLGSTARDRVLPSNVDIFIDDENVIQPDAVVFPEGTKRTARPWKIPAPLWIAEVFSPSTKTRARGVKLRLYARRGVQEAWLVDPDAQVIEVHDLPAGTREVCAEAARSRAIPGLVVDVKEFFAL